MTDTWRSELPSIPRGCHSSDPNRLPTFRLGVGGNVVWQLALAKVYDHKTVKEGMQMYLLVRYSATRTYSAGMVEE